jgi:hypothetical protein
MNLSITPTSSSYVPCQASEVQQPGLATNCGEVSMR